MVHAIAAYLIRGDSPRGHDARMLLSTLQLALYLVDWRHTLDQQEPATTLTWRTISLRLGGYSAPFAAALEAVLREDPRFSLEPVLTLHGSYDAEVTLDTERLEQLPASVRAACDHLLSLNVLRRPHYLTTVACSTHAVLHTPQGETIDLRRRADNYRPEWLGPETTEPVEMITAAGGTATATAVTLRNRLKRILR